MAIENNKLNSRNDIIQAEITTKEGAAISFADFGPRSIYGAHIDHGFWINDLYFNVPPERISSQEENNYLEFQGIRASESYKLPVGISSEYFTVSINIPSKSAIVNVDSRNGEGEDNTGKRGGVLDLIIQFQNIPFACIENAYLRSKLKIPATHNMVFCIHNITFSTSPGEPNCLVANLTISLMAYTPYSDRWLYKKTWVSNDGFSFEDVNPITLPNHTPYYEAPPGSSFTRKQGEGTASGQSEAERKEALLIRAKGLGAISYDSENAILSNESVNIVDPKYTSVDSLNNIDMKYMAPFEITRFARESAPYKAFIDWLHEKYTKVQINNGEFYDCTKISPYSEKDHNLGDEIILKYKEYKTIPLPPKTTDRLRLFFKKNITRFRAKLFSNIYSGTDSLVAEIDEDITGYDSDDLKDNDVSSSEARKLFIKVRSKKTFEDYNNYVIAAEKSGWTLYDEDPTNFDVFYREHTIKLQTNSDKWQENYNDSLLGEHLLVCDFVSCASQNIYKKIPIQGVIHPTAQYLGRPSSQYLMSVKGIGLNSIKIFDLMKDTLKKQALTLKHIKDSFVVKAENPFLNSLGDVYFVINGLEVSTVPEQPGIYSLELRLTGNNLYIKDTKIKRESITSFPELKETFLKELLEKPDGKKLRIGYHFVKSNIDAFGWKDNVFMYGRREKYISENGFYVSSPQKYRSPYVEEIAATLNLILNLIPKMYPDGTTHNRNTIITQEEYSNIWSAALAKHKFLKILTEGGDGEIYANLSNGTMSGYDHAMWSWAFHRRYEHEVIIERNSLDYIGWKTESFGTPDVTSISSTGTLLKPSDDTLKYHPLNNEGTDEMTKVNPKGFGAPHYWDYIIEKSASKLKDARKSPYYQETQGRGIYNLSSPIARTNAWAKSDVFDIRPYARAKDRWLDEKPKFKASKSEESRKAIVVGIMHPYLASHRTVTAQLENIFFMEFLIAVNQKLQSKTLKLINEQASQRITGSKI